MTQDAAIPKIDIRPDHWRIVHAILQKHVPQYAVWAFGSRAKWTAKEYSDLDLAIMTDKPLPLSVSADLSDDFSESDLPWKVDIVDWATTSEAFRKVIERDKVVVKGTSFQSAEQGKRDWGMASKKVADIASRTAIGPFGSRMKSDAYTPSGVPVIRGTNLTGGKYFSGDWVFVSEQTADELVNCCVQTNDLVFPHRGSIGEVGLVPSDFPRYVMSSSLMMLSCDPSKADPNYVYYFFKSHLGRHELLKNSSQVGTPGIGQPLSTLRGIEIPLPNLSKQVAIAKILGSLDNKIDTNHRSNQTLETIAQAIFKSWFVDFDPVKAKIAAIEQGHDPLRAGMRVISGKTDAELDQMPREPYDQLAATAALFPEEMQESEFGEIPKGWAIKTAESIAQIGIGKTPPRKEPQWFTEGAGDWPWVSIRDLGNVGVYQQKTSEFLTAEAVSRFNVKVVPEKTVLLSFKLTIGRVAITDGPMVTNEAIAHFKLRDNSEISTEYLYLLLKQFDYSVLGSTSSIANAVNSKTVREMTIIVPKKRISDRFTQIVRPLFGEIKSLQTEAEAFEKMRNLLLPKLISGEIEVSA
ncbi:MAG: restriction endonuclease subunit S [Azoarcus sp.]|jgi:type I restriction enzyme S subunit|nr:restriction endonuclease subunit S [Azoarcus sp.]